jgi:hypothetical protein
VAALSALPDLLEAQLALVGPAGSDVRAGPVRVFEELECAVQAGKRVAVPDLSEGAVVRELAGLGAVPAEPVQVVEELKDAVLVGKHAAARGPLAGLAVPVSRDSVAVAEPGRGVPGHSTSDAAPVEPDPSEELAALALRDSVAAAEPGCGVPEYLVWEVAPVEPAQAAAVRVVGDYSVAHDR